ncbi:MAG: type II secretion system protein, partial [Propionivibrio sp.]|nr:type II secretion system protein [Propionivibrio sp.]
RKVYRDPMTGTTEWGIERDGNAILAVHSLSTQAPIRRDGFPPELGDVAGSASSYAEWVFRPMEE